ncbi:MAG: Rap1a/Tai family immunity protein [Gammaproteobacteria bacterium]
MTPKLLSCTLVLASLLPGFTQANVTEADFVAKKTQNLLNLCTASPQDPQYREAIHFCHGYLVGAFHFYAAEAADKPELQLVCFTEPKPSRNLAIGMFISWAQKHPEFMNEMPVETEFRFLTEKWPCRR